MSRIPRLLEAAYGSPRPRPGDMLSCLVKTILSQNTNDRLRDVAYRRLREAVGGDWRRMWELSDEELEELIRPAGLPRGKARALRALLGRWDGVGDLCGMEPGQALRRLLAIPGIGPKTARVCLLFVCGHPFFPVDTHIARVARRLGLVPPKASRERIMETLERAFSPRDFYSLHINMIRLGREFCRPRRPRCGECPLRGVCRRVGV